MIYLLVFLVIHLALAAYFMFNLLRQSFEPDAMLFWTMAILFVPIVGSIFYARLGENQVILRFRRKRGTTNNPGRSFPDLNTTAVPDAFANVARTAQRLAGAPLTGGNDVEVFDDPKVTYNEWKQAIEAAKEHVNLLYFTWEADETGEDLRELVCRKAAEGIECRILLDAVGSLHFDEQMSQPLIDAGAKVAFFLPFFRWLGRWSPHMRNHRKILVIDGKVAFVGSQNISNRACGKDPDFQERCDVHLRIEGPAVNHLQQVFADDWLFAFEETLDRDCFFPPANSPGETAVQIVATGPDHKTNTLERLLSDAVGAARGSIQIATPYFVPSMVLRVALQQAALRGVRVRIVVPGQNDVRLLLWAGRSFYGELLDAGIEICEFQGGMLHSKVIVVDDEWAMVGSANMDLRSFRLNFESSALVYDGIITKKLSQILDEYCDDSRAITADELEGLPLKRRLQEGFARVVSSQL